MRNGIPRILIVRLSAIGDVVRVLPALHALRDAFPNGQIDWAVERKSADIVTGHPCLDNVLTFERPQGVVKAAKAFQAFCKRVQSNHYDIVIDFHGISKSGMITWFSKAPKRYGFARPRSREGSHLFTNRKVKLPSKRLSRIKENLTLCKRVAKKINVRDITIYVPDDKQDQVDEFFESMFDGAKLVVAMHIPVDREEKRWPPQYFAKLSDMLQADGRFEVLLTWGPGQYGEVQEVLSRIKRYPTVIPKMPDLKYYTWLVQCADLYFGGDTGPMHIAAAMRTPVVAVFGGTDPLKHAPDCKPSEVLYIPPEGDHKDLSPQQRLELITPEMAYDACVRVATS